MNGWQDVNNEIAKAGLHGHDVVRRLAYKNVSALTKRPLLVYATAFHNPLKAQYAGTLLSIDLSDKDGFHEITKDIEGDAIDILLHSPGGSAEATESIVKMLRSKFKDVRFIVMGAAKSAATMLALSGNVILMGEIGELGPIDPQIRVGGMYAPAGSIIEQFDRATKQLEQHPNQLPVWIPILEKFAPALLVQCQNFIELAKRLVKEWMIEYMFSKDKDAKMKAGQISSYLANEKNTLSHSRHISAEKLESLGVKIEYLNKQDKKLQQVIQKLHLTVMATLDGTNAVKIFENSDDAVLIRQVTIGANIPQKQPQHTGG